MLPAGQAAAEAFYRVVDAAYERLDLVEARPLPDEPGRVELGQGNMTAILQIAADELDLDPGVVRLKSGGGHGGHNGLRDIASALGSRDFHRLRIGIGHPGHKEAVVGHVLSRPGHAATSVRGVPWISASSCIPCTSMRTKRRPSMVATVRARLVRPVPGGPMIPRTGFPKLPPSFRTARNSSRRSLALPSPK